MECQDCEFRSYDLGKALEHFEETKHNEFRIYQVFSDKGRPYTIKISKDEE